MKKIENLEELKNICSGESIDCFIQLNYGFRSSKTISYDKEADTWYIFNELDDTEQTISTRDLKDKTNIIEALNKGALYEY